MCTAGVFQAYLRLSRNDYLVELGDIVPTKVGTSRIYDAEEGRKKNRQEMEDIKYDIPVGHSYIKR